MKFDVGSIPAGRVIQCNIETYANIDGANRYNAFVDFVWGSDGLRAVKAGSIRPRRSDVIFSNNEVFNHFGLCFTYG